jgi:nickel-dependent lactate racemase
MNKWNKSIKKEKEFLEKHIIQKFIKKTTYLRKDTIFEYHKQTLVSLLYTIMELWIHDELNVKKIKEKLEEIYEINNIDIRFIYVFIEN